MMFAARAIASHSISRLSALAGGLPLLALAVSAVSLPATAQAQPTTAPVLVYHSTDLDGVAPDGSLPPGCEPAGQGIIDFDSTPTGACLNITNSFSTQGFRFTTEAISNLFSCDGTRLDLPYNGTTYLGSEEPATITVVREDGASFSLDSIDLGELFTNQGPGQQVQIVGTPETGGPVSITFTLDDVNDGPGGADDFETFAFPSGFVDLVSVTMTGIHPTDPRFSLDNIALGGGGGGLDCAITGSATDRIELWLDGGPNNGAGILCQLSEEGGNGDQVCGADILLEITDGTGKFTRIDAFDATLVHNPGCDDPAGEFCDLPSDPATTILRMNFRRGVGDPPVGRRHIADVHLNTATSTEEMPTVVKMRNFIAAGASLQERSLVTLANGEGDEETIAAGPVPIPEPGRLVMLASGLAGLFALHRIRWRRQVS